MPIKTNISATDSKKMIQLAAGLFAANMRRSGIMNLLSGKMPTGVDGAVSTIRRQSSQEMPVVRCRDLGKSMGDEITFQLDQPVTSYPIMGSRNAEGRGVGMSFSEDRLRIDQARFPISAGNNMSSIRSPWDLKPLAKAKAQSLMDRYCDQSMLVHLCGARGFQKDINWTIPLESEAEYQEVMVNPVRAPTKNRHYIASGSAIKQFAVNAGDMDITTADIFKMDTVDSMRAVLDQIPLPPPAVKIEGDSGSEDSPFRVWLVSPAQYVKFAADPSFRAFKASCHERARDAKNHPLFLGEAGLWNGFIIRKMPYPIRFYAGDTVKYCASTSSETESSCLVPAGFSTNFAVDRSIILGGQSLAEAFGAGNRSGIPFFWSEQEHDHGDKLELLIGTVRGVSKIRFSVETSDTTKEFTDFGVISVDTAVPIIGARS